MGMKPLPPDSKSKGEPASTQAETVEHPRVLVPTSDDMATTLSRPTAPYTTAPSPYDFRPQLPPLVPAAPRSFVPATPYSHVPESSATSPGSVTSRSHIRGPPTHSQQIPIGDNNVSTVHPRGFSGDESSIDSSSIPPRGAKRQLGAQTPKSIQNVNSFAPHSSYFPEGQPGPLSAMMPLYTASQAIPPNAPAVTAYPSREAYSRIKLHIRQQPRAARAGPDGKDRRTIDPPPVLQLLIDDFDQENDLRTLKAHDWVVHAKLVSAQEPREDVTTVSTQSDSGNDKRVTRSLLGTTVSSPFYCSDDPDPENAPKHPRTKNSPPPSPSMRFITTSSRNVNKAKGPDAHKIFPGAFFIFADLSVRKAGRYRLEFRLMKMDPGVLVPGGIVPTLSVAVSEVFNVVNAKDFDQVQPSTNLVKGLLDRGAGFPLKLKKGLRDGQRRRARGTGSDDDEHDSQDEEDTG